MASFGRLHTWDLSLHPPRQFLGTDSGEEHCNSYRFYRRGPSGDSVLLQLCVDTKWWAAWPVSKKIALDTTLERLIATHPLPGPQRLVLWDARMKPNEPPKLLLLKFSTFSHYVSGMTMHSLVEANGEFHTGAFEHIENRYFPSALYAGRAWMLTERGLVLCNPNQNQDVDNDVLVSWPDFPQLDSSPGDLNGVLVEDSELRRLYIPMFLFGPWPTQPSNSLKERMQCFLRKPQLGLLVYNIPGDCRVESNSSNCGRSSGNADCWELIQLEQFQDDSLCNFPKPQSCAIVRDSSGRSLEFEKNGNVVVRFHICDPRLRCAEKQKSLLQIALVRLLKHSNDKVACLSELHQDLKSLADHILQEHPTLVVADQEERFSTTETQRASNSIDSPEPLKKSTRKAISVIAMVLLGCCALQLLGSGTL